VTPQANVRYDITGISGTYTIGGNTYAITSLESYNADDKFEWDGTLTSAILTSNNGISFAAGNDVFANPYSLQISGYEPLFRVKFFFNDDENDIFITSSSLSPQAPDPDPASVPGPLPLMGAGAAFAWSRRLRKRVASRPAFRL